jgi:hypothetical protein
MMVPVTCPHCGNEADNEVEVTIDSGPVSPSYGLPEYSSPGEGAEWHVEGDITCNFCNEVIDVDWMNDNLNDAVQERASEPPDPPEYDDFD